MADPTTLPQPPAAARAPSPSAPAAAADVKVSPKAIGWLRKAGHGSRLLGGVMARRRSFDSVLVGCLLTLLVIAFDAAGWLTPLEFLLYDTRAAVFQFFLPPPTD